MNVDKIIIITCLIIAIYFTAICPCKIILSCHKYTFYILLLLPLIYVGYSQNSMGK